MVQIIPSILVENGKKAITLDEDLFDSKSIFFKGY